MPVIFYESPHRLIDFLQDLSELFPDRKIFLVKELTKMYEGFYSGSTKELFAELKNEKILGEWVAVVDISGCKPNSINLDIEELKGLSLPKKELAKLISKITGESPKALYEQLL